MLKTSQLATKIGVHPNSIRHYLKQYGVFIPHTKISNVTYYEDTAIERINEIKAHIEKGIVGSDLVEILNDKYDAVVEGEVDDKEPVSKQTTIQTKSSNNTTMALQVSHAGRELERYMNQLLKTSNEHNNQLEAKQNIIDTKNREVADLQTKLTELEGKLGQAQRKINRLSFLGWREK